ncbi:glutamate--tRNA ligase [Jeongeupia chitinilytica]|uniref:Glutamate--tRNA ligase n=1 Tax=Jeongeupia chitinilytica TaxID=1041641 RepID=A0ABQ3H577_9NEIS|nr:glutamate--tRNA ligase [Jeongeupia chitinilytica]GHD68658.1 glutamate--tRNA ligase [Jeongeupia chitinilytica]
MTAPTSAIRTRFAPSPTGLLHIGGVRTALFSWAYARKHQGVFVLRIEDTDLERSTPESVAAIMDGMHWVGLDYDEGPFYQMQRMDRYKQVIAQMLASGHAYHCYCSREELDAMRAEAEARGEKPRYDRRWRPEDGKVLPAAPAGVSPVVRFRTPIDGVVAWDDQVKGRIEISNTELDDLIIARPDGTPTYNFCVVVDDWDMQISHVIRGDDHVNNTPRQIHMYQALGAAVPVFAHLPMIFNDQGQKMSKRRDAVSVVDYDKMGFLPEALLNYLARLGWGHGDDEFFTMDQFVEWFDLADVSPSPSRFDRDKLLWLNAQHIKTAEPQRLAERVAAFLTDKGVDTASGPALTDVCVLLKDRSQTLVEMADQAEYFYRPLVPSADVAEKHLTPDDEARLGFFAEGAARLETWDQASLGAFIKDFVKQQGVKMPQVGMPLRAKVCGITNTPSVDAVLALIGRDEVLRRLAMRN